MSDKTQSSNSPQKRTPKQNAALLGVVLLVLMYVITLLAALFDSSHTGNLFRLCIGCTLLIPIMIWIYVWMYGKFTGKDNFTNPKSEEE
ncbi:hypothetical protein LJC58_07135 [Lachnospiraceae bacterium OttesenSCG-928-D06]|nr:hypothetical protein [Lachnospiraceae bacterium OttesenSCG-928-D06]MDL2302110.1 hypothetical protein [Lachnospiraceae bacterium OttesenSCG-928-D06]